MTKARRTPRQGRPPKWEEPLLDAHILDCARREFLEHGYSATTVDMIAARARSSKRTIYARYPTKAALFEAAAADHIDRMIAPIEAAINPQLAVREQLIRLGKALLAAATDPASLAMDRIVIGEANTFPELAARLHQGGFERITMLVARLLKDAGATNPAIGSETFYALLALAPMRAAIVTKKKSIVRVDQIVDFLLRTPSI